MPPSSSPLLLPRSRAPQLWVWGTGAAALLASVVIGALVAFLPFWLLAALMVLVCVPVLTIVWPVAGILFVLLAGSGLIPPHYLPQIPLMGGRIHAEDLFLFFVLGVIVVKATISRESVLKAFQPFAVSVLLLFILIVIAVIQGALLSGASMRNVLAEARPLMYWLLFPATVISLRSSDQIRRFLLGVSAIGCLLALALVAQSATGIQFVSGGRLEIAETLGTYYQDVYRSTAPGILLLVFAMILIAARFLRLSISRPVAFALFSILAAGLLVTFGRALWLASAVGLLVMGISLGTRSLIRLVAFGSIGLVVLIGGLAIKKSDYAVAIQDRLLSVGRELKSGQSWDWRKLENYYAWKGIETHPLLGIGLGADYKPVDSRLPDPEQARKMHNGYLYFLLKLGAIAAVPLVWIYLTWIRVVHRAKESTRLASDQAILAALLGASVVPLITSFVRPDWMEAGAIGAIAVLFGVGVSLAEAAQKVQESEDGGTSLVGARVRRTPL